MRKWHQMIRWLFLALLVTGGLGLAGCKTDDEPSNEAVRPWNAPKTWENGLPSGMWERR
jgi:hypothetical protein